MLSEGPKQSPAAFDKCPPLGTPEYAAYVERQSQRAWIHAMNAHPILRVGSTIVILMLGLGGLTLAWPRVDRPWWEDVLACIVFTVYGIGWLSYLKYSWGKQRPD